MPFSRAQGSVVATVKVKGGSAVQCRLSCVVCLGTDGGLIVLDAEDEKYLSHGNVQRLLLTPANGSVQRVNGNLFIVEASERGVHQPHTSITFAILDESSELFQALCSVLAVWPIQRRVGRLTTRYTAKVASLAKHGRPSRANSLLIRGTTANGSARMTAPVLSRPQEPGRAMQTSRSSSSVHDSPFVRSSRVDESSGSRLYPLSSLPRRRARSAQPQMHHKVTSDDDADVMNFCEAVVDMMQKSGTMPVALGGGTSSAAVRAAQPGGPLGGRPLTDRAASALKQYLPLFAPVLYKYEMLNMTLLRGPTASALSSTVHASSSSTHSVQAASVGGQGEAQPDPCDGFFRARMKELLKLVSYLSEAASCTVTGRNGLSRKAHRRVRHSSKHTVAVQMGLRTAGKKNEAPETVNKSDEVHPAPAAQPSHAQADTALRASIAEGPHPVPPVGIQQRALPMPTVPQLNIQGVLQGPKHAIPTTQRSVIVPGSFPVPEGHRAHVLATTTSSHAWPAARHSAPSVAATSTVADGAESVSASGGGGYADRQYLGPPLDMSQGTGAMWPSVPASRAPTPMHQLAKTAAPFFPRAAVQTSTSAWEAGMQAPQTPWQAGFAGQQQWGPGVAHGGSAYLPYAMPQGYMLQGTPSVSMPMHVLNQHIRPVQQQGAMQMMYVPVGMGMGVGAPVGAQAFPTQKVHGSSGYPILLTPNGQTYVGVPMPVGLHGTQ